VSSFGWLLDLLPAESVTPAPKGVATGVTETVAVHGRNVTAADEVSHPSHLSHAKYTAGDDREFLQQYAREDDLAEHLTERAAIMQHDGGLDRAKADVAAVRIVQCSTCRHWTPDPLGGGGIGTCATGADSESLSAFDQRPLSAWPHAPRHCTRWDAHGRQ